MLSIALARGHAHRDSSTPTTTREVFDVAMDQITGAIIDIGLKAHLITISYDGLEDEGAFRADLLVEECVIVEIKSVDRRARAHTKQLLTYLRLANLQVGLLLNFGAETMKEGIERVVNNYIPPSLPLLRVDHSRVRENSRSITPSSFSLPRCADSLCAVRRGPGAPSVRHPLPTRGGARARRSSPLRARSWRGGRRPCRARGRD
jgi:hypothetical protein